MSDISYDISVTDFKVKIANSGVSGDDRYTFSRETYSATYNDGRIEFRDGTDINRLTISNILDVNSITDYRGSSTSSITVPATLVELFDDVIEDNDNPFFFESIQVDAGSPVSTLVEGSSSTETGAVKVIEDLEGEQINLLQGIQSSLNNIEKYLIRILEE